MIQQLSKVKNGLKNQIDLIQRPSVNLMNKIILTRSLVENLAVFNFLKNKNTYQRIELFQVFGDFEWYSHQIYYSHPKTKRNLRFQNFLIKTEKRYPNGYQKYGQLIKRRLCKKLRELIKNNPKNADHWQSKLDLINSNQPNLHDQQINLLASFMSHHLITKLPFPYRIVFGKSITFFVLKYSHINRNIYWLLSDLSHGTLIENHLNERALIKIIQKVITIANSSL